MSSSREEYRFKNMCSYHFIPIRLINIKKTETTGDNVEKLESSYTVGGNVKWYSHHGKLYFLKKLPSTCLLGMYPKELKVKSQTDVCT